MAPGAASSMAMPSVARSRALSWILESPGLEAHGFSSQWEFLHSGISPAIQEPSQICQSKATQKIHLSLLNERLSSVLLNYPVLIIIFIISISCK